MRKRITYKGYKFKIKRSNIGMKTYFIDMYVVRENSWFARKEQVWNETITEHSFTTLQQEMDRIIIKYMMHITRLDAYRYEAGEEEEEEEGA